MSKTILLIRSDPIDLTLIRYGTDLSKLGARTKLPSKRANSEENQL